MAPPVADTIQPYAAPRAPPSSRADAGTTLGDRILRYLA
jgi:hypothetical protein